MAMKRPGIYAPLSAYYFDDAAIMEVGEDAELLYVRMLAYAARQMEFEGFISDRVILTRLGIMPRESGNGTGNVPGTDAGSRAGLLAEYGLLTREEGGYRISGWLKWNKSAAELGKERARDRQRKTTPDKGVRFPGPGNDTGNRSGTDAGIRRQRPDHIQTRPDHTLGDGPNGTVEIVDVEVCSSADAESESDPETEAELFPAEDPGPSRTDHADDFAAWWELYPRKVGKGQAARAYRTARKKATAEALTAAIVTQGPLLMARGVQYCPHASTWLNGERWRDDPSALRTTDPNRWTASDFDRLIARAERNTP